MPIGDEIKRLRKLRGLTQKQLGEMCGMADSAIRKYESGKIKPKIESLRKIAAALQVDVYSLADFDTASEMLEEHINGGQEKKEVPPVQEDKREVSEDDIKFALFGGAGEITDEMYDEVKAFVKFVKMKHGQE